jgi:hypothetical protein
LTAGFVVALLSSVTLLAGQVEAPVADSKPAAEGRKAEKPEWKVGYQWVYASKSPGKSEKHTSEIIREEIFEGVPSFVVRHKKNENYYAKDVLGLFAQKTDGKLVFRRDKPRENFLWPLEVGKEWRSAYLRENILEKSSQTFDYRMVVTGIEEVKVPAGIFTAFKVEVRIAYNGNLFAEYWYAPVVKRSVKDKEYLQDGLHESELINYHVD